jgi:hypothetical protein
MTATIRYSDLIRFKAPDGYIDATRMAAQRAGYKPSEIASQIFREGLQARGGSIAERHGRRRSESWAILRRSGGCLFRPRAS